MSLRNIGIVYRKELTESLRDRRTLLSSILVPLLLFPVLTVGFGYAASEIMGAARKHPSKIMVLGGEDSPGVLAELRALGMVRVVPASADYAEQISNSKIQAAVEMPRGFEAAATRGDNPTIKIYMYEGDLKSSMGVERIEGFFRRYRDRLARERLAAHNLPAALVKPFEIQQQNVASPEKIFGSTFGGIIVYMVILLSMTGAMYPAMDLTAGEKERGTIETILTSPVDRNHLVLGKFLMVLTASVATVALSVISMGFSFLEMSKLGLSSGDAHPFVFSVDPKAILGVFFMALPVAVLFSAALFTISLFAKTVKEAQSYLTPLTFVVVIPAVASLLPGVELTAKLAVIPILNVSLACKEIISGTYHWNNIVLIFLSTCVYAAAAIFLAVKMFEREDVLFRS